MIWLVAETFSGHKIPVDLPSVFSTPKSFVRQSLDAPPRNSERKRLDYESGLETTQQQEIQNDTTTSWEFLETFNNKLGAQAINYENLLIFTEVHGVPPRMTFSCQIFEYRTISCFKRFSQIKYNDTTI